MYEYMTNSYREKYFKYKTKYLKINNLLGGEELNKNIYNETNNKLIRELLDLVYIFFRIIYSLEDKIDVVEFLDNSGIKNYQNYISDEGFLNMEVHNFKEIVTISLEKIKSKVKLEGEYEINETRFDELLEQLKNIDGEHTKMKFLIDFGKSMRRIEKENNKEDKNLDEALLRTKVIRINYINFVKDDLISKNKIYRENIIKITNDIDNLIDKKTSSSTSSNNYIIKILIELTKSSKGKVNDFNTAKSKYDSFVKEVYESNSINDIDKIMENVKDFTADLKSKDMFDDGSKLSTNTIMKEYNRLKDIDIQKAEEKRKEDETKENETKEE